MAPIEHRATIRRAALAALGAACLAAGAAGSAPAAEPGVFQDEGGPAAREYALPFESARRDAGATGNSGARGSVPFGAGITPAAAASGASRGEGDSGDGGGSSARSGARGAGEPGADGPGGAGGEASRTAVDPVSSEGAPLGLWISAVLISAMFGWILLSRFRRRRGDRGAGSA
jgi:hypothetical protein